MDDIKCPKCGYELNRDDKTELSNYLLEDCRINKLGEEFTDVIWECPKCNEQFYIDGKLKCTTDFTITNVEKVEY